MGVQSGQFQILWSQKSLMAAMISNLSVTVYFVFTYPISIVLSIGEDLLFALFVPLALLRDSQ
jgi:hypothetical protein